MLQNGIGLEKYTKLIGKGMHGNHPAYDKQEELIPDLKEKIIKAKNSGMNLNEYFNFFLTNEIFYYRRIY